MATRTAPELARRYRTIDEFEEALARQAVLDEKRRRELQRRAANRSRARRIARAQRSGRVRFSVLASALTLTVVVVVVVMFETLAWLVGG